MKITVEQMMNIELDLIMPPQKISEEVSWIKYSDKQWRKRFNKLWKRRKELTLTEICDLNIDIGDRLQWLIQFFPLREAKLLGCDFAEITTHLIPEKHRIVHENCLYVARKFIENETFEKELKEARESAQAVSFESMAKVRFDSWRTRSEWKEMRNYPLNYRLMVETAKESVILAATPGEERRAAWFALSAASRASEQREKLDNQLMKILRRYCVKLDGNFITSYQ